LGDLNKLKGELSMTESLISVDEKNSQMEKTEFDKDLYLESALKSLQN